MKNEIVGIRRGFSTINEAFNASLGAKSATRFVDWQQVQTEDAHGETLYRAVFRLWGRHVASPLRHWMLRRRGIRRGISPPHSLAEAHWVQSSRVLELSSRSRGALLIRQ